MAKLVVNADDLGAHPDIDRGILRAFQDGIVTSTSLLVTMRSDWQISAEAASRLGLPMGLHLSLTEGTPVSSPERIPDLVAPDGSFFLSAYRLATMSPRNLKHGSSIYGQVRTELEAQLTLLLKRGFTPTHLDSHQHFHMNPHIFRIVDELAVKHGVGVVRFVREPVFLFQLCHNITLNWLRKNPLKAAMLAFYAGRISRRTQSADRFFGVMASGNVDRFTLEHLLRAIARTNLTWEICTHPGFPVNDRPLGTRFAPFYKSKWRLREFHALTDSKIKDLVRKEQIELTSYARV